MRQRFFGVLACVSITAIATTVYAWPAGEYRNIAGPVTGSYAAGINGSFRLEAGAGTIGLLSEGWGGACIVFRAEDLGLSQMAQKHCTRDSQCTQRVGQFGASVGVSGYCDRDTNKCWAKPFKPSVDAGDKAVCRRFIPGLSPAPMQPGIDNLIAEQPINVAALGVKKLGVRARVLTCLHGIPWGGCAGIPGSAPSKDDWGDPTPL